MAIIYSYPTVIPTANDLVLGTDVDASGKPTKNFTVQSIIDLVTVSGNDLQAVLNNGNTATQNIVLTGNISATQYTDGTMNITNGVGTGFTAFTSTAITGTLQTAAQPNITSLGTLTSLKVGNATPAITSIVTSFTAPGDNIKLATTKAIVDYIGTNPPGAESLAATLLVGNTTGATKIEVDNTGSGIDFIDDAKARFGTGNDLEIYHNGSHSFIKNVGTGELRIPTSMFRVTKANDSATLLEAQDAGAVKLYFANNEKLATTNTGISITGNTVATGSGTFVNIFNTGYYSDSSGDVGNAGQILSSTGSGTNWINDPNPTPYTWIIEADSGAGSPYTVANGDTIDFVGVGNIDTAWDNSSKELRISLGGTSISGTGANTQVVYWTGAQTVSGDAGMVYNDTSNSLTVSGTVQGGTLSDGTFSGSSGTYTGGVSITSTTFVGALTGNASTASSLASAGTITITGDTSSTNSPTYTSGGNVSIATTIADTTVTGKVLTNLPSPTSSTIAASDTILAAMAKLQGQITGIPQGLVYQGTWNANTNTPTLASGTGTTGYFYIVSVAGSTNLDGITDWQVGDWAIFIEQGANDQWEKIDNTSAVTGTGTANKLAKWTAPTVLATGLVEDNGTTVTIGNSGNLVVEGNTTLGDADADTTLIKGPGTADKNFIIHEGLGVGTSPDYGSAGQILSSGGGASSANVWIDNQQGTVTSVATNNGLTGGTITTSGTIGIDTVGTNNAIEFLSSATPVTSDIIWFSDVSDSNTLRKCTISALEGILGPYLPLAGGTMAGAINMGTNNITNGGTATFTTFSGDLNGTINTATTAVTQSQGNNSTKVATTAYVDAAIGNSTLAEVLVNGNTTGGTDIAVSANDDITFTDSSKALFGAGSDLKIYHDGSNSYINESGTGDLVILSNTVSINNAANSENLAKFLEDGPVKLYYDNVQKFQTISGGIEVTGDADVSGEVQVGGQGSNFSENNLRFKSAGAAYIDHNTVGQSFIFRVSGSSSLDTTALTIKSNGEIQADDYGSGNNTGTPTYNLEVDSSGNIIETPSFNPGGKGGVYTGNKSFTGGAAAATLFRLTRGTTGALVFDVYLTSGTSQYSVKKYTVAHILNTTPTYNKIIDSGFTTNGDYTVAFVNDGQGVSGDTVKCTIAATTTQDIYYTVVVGHGATAVTRHTS